LGEDRFVADDVRTLEVRYGASGERLRTFRESVKEFQQVEFADFPLMPRTTLDYAKAIAAVSESAVAQHHMWVGASRIPEGDRSIFEDECLARVLDAAVTYDCLDITNLCWMELVVRHRQLIAYAHSQSPGMPSYLAEDHCMGQPRRAGGGIVTASLTDHVSKQMAAQSKIMKEKRKMEEAKSIGPPVVRAVADCCEMRTTAACKKAEAVGAAAFFTFLFQTSGPDMFFPCLC
jgi:hypothetical protein